MILSVKAGDVITVEGEAYDMTCRSPGACEDVHPECARGWRSWSVNAEVTSWGEGLHRMPSGYRSSQVAAPWLVHPC
jgi:hypothetical protein